MKKIIFLFLITFSFILKSNAQHHSKDSAISTSLITVNYAYQFPGNDLFKRFLSIVGFNISEKFPGNDLSKRFYSNSAIGSSYLYKTKSNWFMGADGFFMFRDKIKETGILDSISTSDGNVIDGNGIYADIRTVERGFYLGVKGGKLFPIFGTNKNSGIIVLLGGGFMQHKIRIENTGNTAAQLKGEYKKGYDRLTNGLAISEFIGYMYHGNSRFVNFFGGFEFVQAFTQNRRSFDYDLMAKNNTKRIDLLSGFKVGWIISLHKRQPEKFYFN